MASNAMYRQLLNEAVNNNSKQGSALMGGARMGGAMMGGGRGGYFDKGPKKGPNREGKDPIKVQRGKDMQTPANKEKMRQANDFRQQYINAQLYQAYGDREKISYNERIDVITQAKKDLHERKLAAMQYKRDNMSNAEKDREKEKREDYRIAALKKVGLENTKEGRKKYREMKGIGGPKSPEEKAESRAVNQMIKQAKATARVQYRQSRGIAPRMAPNPVSQQVAQAYRDNLRLRDNEEKKH